MLLKALTPSEQGLGVGQVGLRAAQGERGLAPASRASSTNPARRARAAPANPPNAATGLGLWLCPAEPGLLAHLRPLRGFVLPRPRPSAPASRMLARSPSYPKRS